MDRLVSQPRLTCDVCGVQDDRVGPGQVPERGAAQGPRRDRALQPQATGHAWRHLARHAALRQQRGPQRGACTRDSTCPLSRLSIVFGNGRPCVYACFSQVEPLSPPADTPVGELITFDGHAAQPEPAGERSRSLETPC